MSKDTKATKNASANSNSSASPNEATKPTRAPKKPAIEPNLQDHLHALDVLTRARAASVEVHNGAGVGVLDRYLRDLKRRMKKWQRVEVRYVET